MKAMHYRHEGDAVETSADRELLIAYLEYAVSDVAALDETSASLLQLAIAHLRGARGGVGLLQPGRKLC